MISENCCLEVMSHLYGRTTTFTYREVEGSGEEQKIPSEFENCLGVADLYRPLLARYSFEDMDSAVRWLQLGGHISTVWPFEGLDLKGYRLTQKGLDVAEAGRFPPEERAPVSYTHLTLPTN